ncbi:MAG: DUF2933 domain-containing protein [Cellulomonas sp.]
MTSPMQGPSHGGKNHLLGMLGIGVVVVVVLLVAGRNFHVALPLAAFLACPLMMIGMMFMMRRGNSHQHDASTSIDHRTHDSADGQAGSAPSQPDRRSAFIGLATAQNPPEGFRGQ